MPLANRRSSTDDQRNNVHCARFRNELSPGIHENRRSNLRSLRRRELEKLEKKRATAVKVREKRCMDNEKNCAIKQKIRRMMTKPSWEREEVEIEAIIATSTTAQGPQDQYWVTVSVQEKNKPKTT